MSPVRATSPTRRFSESHTARHNRDPYVFRTNPYIDEQAGVLYEHQDEPAFS